MEIILLGIYSAIVWFIFFKKKWLPWNITSQVIVVTIPVICLTILILFMNIVAPSSSDVRRELRHPDRAAGDRKGHRGADQAESSDQKGDVLFKWTRCRSGAVKTRKRR
jgi:hypothetical protein